MSGLVSFPGGAKARTVCAAPPRVLPRIGELRKLALVLRGRTLLESRCSRRDTLERESTKGEGDIGWTCDSVEQRCLCRGFSVRMRFLPHFTAERPLLTGTSNIAGSTGRRMTITRA